MPSVIPREQAIRDQLRDAIKDVAELNGKLEAVVAVKARQPSGIFHGKVDHSQPPWNSVAANCILDLHAQVRDMEIELRFALDFPDRPRGGSDANTRKALEAVQRLCEGADDHIVVSATRDLRKWVKRALIALGEVEAPRRIPRLPGEKEPACPWCDHHTLRMLPLEGLIVCVTPKCSDEEGRKPKARMQFSSHVGDFVLVWQDQRG